MEKFLGDMCSSAIAWGPGLLLAILMLVGLYRLIKGIGIKIVAALEKPAEALTIQAKAMEKLTDSLTEYSGRDQFAHREIMMLQKVILDRLEAMKNGKN